MEIDLSKDAVLAVETAKLITAIEPESRSIYTNYIDSLSIDNKISGLSLLLQTSNRNTTSSTIHETLCKYNLLIVLLQRHVAIRKIIVDHKYDEQIVYQICKSYNNSSEIIRKKKLNLHVYITVAYNFIKSVYLMLINIFMMFSTGLRGFKKPIQSVIYIDTFMAVSSIEKSDNFYERYYDGIETSVDNDVLNKIWYVPTLFDFNTINDFYKLYKFCVKSNGNIIHQHNYLKPYDYIKALWVSFVTVNSIKKYPKWKGYDVSYLIANELRCEYFSTQLFNSVLKYLFINRLAQSGVVIDLVIDWNENQVIDRALCLGVRDSYPNVQIKGYQGLVPPKYYASLEPTCFEIESNIVPDITLVTGEAFVESKKVNCKSLNVAVAPAYRFRHLHDIERNSYLDNKVVFVALPYYLNQCVQILNILLDTIKIIEKYYTVEIKVHPSYTNCEFNEILPSKLKSKFSFTELNISELLSVASCLFSSGSSTCVEAAVLGIPVAIMGNLSGPTQNPLVDLIDKDRWSVIYEASELLAFIKCSEISNELDVNYYFKKVSRRESNIFLSKI